MERVRIINTGGTFNKRYDPVAGRLFVPADDRAVEAALASLRANRTLFLGGAIYKDSLEMDDADRDLLCEMAAETKEDAIVIVHGTDTMKKSAEALAGWPGVAGKKRVVLTGAMVPFSIDPTEATANLVSAVTAAGFLDPGVYIAMHGLVLPWRKIRKNREAGRFERVE
ncbi:asparaginase domain-containing protein [Hydrogenimonas urashimensis]|uniref:asparaginase domain-containing protein n=1 Tax=Hydrogenimonas urashimensis TaxID=2740515 RepID=UPI0019162272|nr:asparaginase domain-containing protein [Hydrogenimonas urashimensis]